MKYKQIIILGAGNTSLDAYDLLLGYGLDICCFSSENEADNGKVLFGKRVLKRAEIIKNIKNPVFIEANSRYSAWGFGGVDFYHYIGYKRNQNYFLLKDYIEIPKNGFMHIFSHVMEDIHKKIVLVGDFWLCLKLGRILEGYNDKMCGRIIYCDVLEEHHEKKEGLKWAARDEICTDDIWLLLIPGYIGYYDDAAENHSHRETVKRNYLLAARRIQPVDILDYPIESSLFFDAAECQNKQNFLADLKVKRIILGSIDDHSGNVFFRGLLDNHPQILSMNYNFINENLFYICIRLAMENKHNILSLLWEFYDKERDDKIEDEWGESVKNAFSRNMEKLLTLKDEYSSQELFVMIHIAYAKAWERTIQNITDMVIYWEPHNMLRENLEDYAIWLGQSGVSGQIINVVRNAYMQKGSRLRGLENQGLLLAANKSVFNLTLSNLNIKRKEYEGWTRNRVRFEDLKLNPRKELSHICDEWEIAWSDILLDTTLHGQKHIEGDITGFDLTPVYRTYEEYYSEFDRFRIMLISGPFQKYYGYPYVSILDFSRKELQVMFQKKFRFENYLEYDCDEEEMQIWYEMQKRAGAILWSVRREEIMQ